MNTKVSACPFGSLTRRLSSTRARTEGALRRALRLHRTFGARLLGDVAMLFRILGNTVATGSGGDAALGGPRHRLLLTALLMTPGRIVPTERLIEALWDDSPPRRATDMLHVRI